MSASLKHERLHHRAADSVVAMMRRSGRVDAEPGFRVGPESALSVGLPHPSRAHCGVVGNANRVGAEPASSVGLPCPPRRPRAPGGLDEAAQAQPCNDMLRVGPELGVPNPAKPDKKAVQKKPAGQAKRILESGEQGNEAAQRMCKKGKGDGGSPRKQPSAAFSSPKASKKAASKKAASPRTPASTPPRMTSPASTGLPSSPISLELMDALPGPMHVREICQPAVLHLQSLCKQLGAKGVASRIGRQVWELHTACSGLGCPEVALEAIQAALPRLGPDFANASVEIQHGMKIDKNEASQATLMANFPDSCLFGQLEDWLEGHARSLDKMRLKQQCKCLRHEDCPLPSKPSSASDASFVVMIAGPPCNPWSKRGKRTGNKHADAFAHVIWTKIALEGPYDIVIFENVWDQELIDNLHKHFSEQFDIHVSVVSAAMLGYPVARKRMYALMLRKSKCYWNSGMLFQMIVDMMQRKCRMNLEQLWFLRSAGLAEHSAWDPALSGWDNLTPGQRGHAEGYQRLHHGRRVWDLSQNPDRAPRFENDGSLMTLLTNTVPFSVAKQRALSPMEALVAHGIPAVPEVTPPGMRTWSFPVSEGAKRILAGMSMHVPSVTAVILAAMVFVEKRPP